MSNKSEVVVSFLETGKKPPRLDVYLAEHCELSRNRVQRLIEDGQVTIDGEAIKMSHRLRVGERIVVDIPPPTDLMVKPEDLPLEIIYEDDCFAVINKPAGMVTHPGNGVTTGTLVNALLHHMKGSLSGIGGIIRPGIVHRLDKETTGLLVVAKEDFSHQHLSEQIRTKSAVRIYLSLLSGNLASEEGTIDKSIGRHPIKRKQMAVVEGGKHAVSHYKILERFDRFTLVEVKLETGRTHQIRVHMAAIGHPVAGDLLYNRGDSGTISGRAKLGLSSHALHSSQLTLIHPRKGCLLEFRAPLPQDFQTALRRLRSNVSH
jgi:23S rRNA pseudouridine1911/1915/1917 synthase